MKLGKVFVFFIGFFALSVHTGFSAPSFSEANARYEAQDYKAAAELYEQIAAHGENTAALCYNLGNAYFRIGQKGKALVAYERARRLSPRDADVRWNMEILKSVLTDRLGAFSESPLERAMSRAAGFLSLEETGAALSAALAAVFLLTIFVWFFPPARRWILGLQMAAGGILIAFSILLLFQWHETGRPQAVVLAKDVYARYGPSDRETKAFVLHEGAEGSVLDETKGWLYLRFPNGQSAWVPKSSCEVI